MHSVLHRYSLEQCLRFNIRLSGTHCHPPAPPKNKTAVRRTHSAPSVHSDTVRRYTRPRRVYYYAPSRRGGSRGLHDAASNADRRGAPAAPSKGASDEGARPSVQRRRAELLGQKHERHLQSIAGSCYLEIVGGGDCAKGGRASRCAPGKKDMASALYRPACPSRPAMSSCGVV